METRAKPALFAFLPPLPVIVSLLTIYIVWGSTYLVTRFTIQSIPPFTLTAMRSVIASILLLSLARMRGQRATTHEIRNAFVVGMLLFGGGAGLVAFSVKFVESGLAALAVAAVPLWAAIFAGLFGQWPGKVEWLGLLVGISGVILLNMENGMRGNPIGAAALFAGPMMWAFASMWSRRLRMPKGMVATGYQLLGGAVILVVIVLLTGERITMFPTRVAIFGFLYLTFISSVLAFSAYMYLIGNVRPVIATSYAYVNPVLAVILGITLGGETITSTGFLTMAVILSGVALLAAGKQRKPLTA